MPPPLVAIIARGPRRPSRPSVRVVVELGARQHRAGGPPSADRRGQSAAPRSAGCVAAGWLRPDSRRRLLDRRAALHGAGAGWLRCWRRGERRRAQPPERRPSFGGYVEPIEGPIARHRARRPAELDRGVVLHRTRLPRAGARAHRGIPVTPVDANAARPRSQVGSWRGFAELSRRPIARRAARPGAARPICSPWRAAKGTAAGCGGSCAEYRPATDTRSELEREFLRLCRRWRLPTPATNVPVRGLERRRVWPSARLVVELDGYAYHRSPQQFERDRRRDAPSSSRAIEILRRHRPPVSHAIPRAARDGPIAALGRLRRWNYGRRATVRPGGGWSRAAEGRSRLQATSGRSRSRRARPRSRRWRSPGPGSRARWSRRG